MQELMFDPNVPGCFRELTKQEKQKKQQVQIEVDVYYDSVDAKLFVMSMLDDDEYNSLQLAIDSIRHFFYGDNDKYSNSFVSFDDRQYNGLDLSYYVGGYLLDNEQWCRLLRHTPLHECYSEFVRPLRQYIKQLLEKESNYEYDYV